MNFGFPATPDVTGLTTTAPEPHKWAFRARLRRHAFGPPAKPAIAALRTAMAEIRKIARTDPPAAAEGAVLLLERLSPALENVERDCGALTTALAAVIDELVPLLAKAPVSAKAREAWLARLSDAAEADDWVSLAPLGDHWGALCVTPAAASQWADRLAGRAVPPGRIAASLSALLAAERYTDIVDRLDAASGQRLPWAQRRYGVQALAALGRTDEAVRYAEDGRGGDGDAVTIARACEAVLLAAGRTEEAYQHYGLTANQDRTYLSWFRAVAKTYPDKPAERILADLVALTPGSEGKWYAAANEVKRLAPPPERIHGATRLVARRPIKPGD